MRCCAASAARSAPHRRPKAPATHDVIARMIAACPTTTLIGLRDRALLVLGFAGAFRRSELVALEVADLVEVPDGLRIAIRRSKTDQEGAGPGGRHPARAPLRPVETVQAWLAAAAISDGPVFRPVSKGGRVGATALGDDGYVRAIKKRARAAGLDPALYSGHSLRAGFLTAPPSTAPRRSSCRRSPGTARSTCCRATCGGRTCSKATLARGSCDACPGSTRAGSWLIRHSDGWTMPDNGGQRGQPGTSGSPIRNWSAATHLREAAGR